MVFSPKLVARYQELKEQVPDCLLLMQVGTFMQVIDEDARRVVGHPPGRGRGVIPITPLCNYAS